MTRYTAKEQPLFFQKTFSLDQLDSDSGTLLFIDDETGKNIFEFLDGESFAFDIVVIGQTNDVAGGDVVITSWADRDILLYSSDASGTLLPPTLSTLTQVQSQGVGTALNVPGLSAGDAGGKMTLGLQVVADSRHVKWTAIMTGTKTSGSPLTAG